MSKNGRKIYLQKDVLTSAKERINMIFDRYDRVVCSVSGGKDSTVLFDLTYNIAQERNKKVVLFFLDQEAEYDSTIKLMRELMKKPNIEKAWFQVPIKMTNSTSYKEDMLHAWEEGVEWIREKEPDSIHSAPNAPDRFYTFLEWYEAQQNTAFLIGLRAEESLNRYGAVTSHPALPNIPWSSKGKGETIKFYPLYDWTFEDIWTYIGKFHVPYNKAYDWMWVSGHGISSLRVSNLIHEKSFRCLTDLQKIEPENYDRLVKRLDGVRSAAKYGKEQFIYDNKKLPKQFKDWKEYRDYLLINIPISDEKKEKFKKRFKSKSESVAVLKQQVKQLLINDYENSIPVVERADNNSLAKWKDIL